MKRILFIILCFILTLSGNFLVFAEDELNDGVPPVVDYEGGEQIIQEDPIDPEPEICEVCLEEICVCEEEIEICEECFEEPCICEEEVDIVTPITTEPPETTTTPATTTTTTTVVMEIVPVVTAPLETEPFPTREVVDASAANPPVETLDQSHGDTATTTGDDDELVISVGNEAGNSGGGNGSFWLIVTLVVMLGGAAGAAPFVFRYYNKKRIYRY